MYKGKIPNTHTHFTAQNGLLFNPTEEEDVQEREDQFVTHQQRWATKVRRRSSDMKSFVSDKLELADNPKITAILNKNGIIINHNVLLIILFRS